MGADSFSPEITDLLVDFDPVTLQRRPVRRDDVVNRLRAAGNDKAAALAARLPEVDGVLESEKIDALMVRVHCEIQRLSEEFHHGQRMLELLTPLLRAIRSVEGDRPLRVVDVGCGTGYVIRWLAAKGGLDRVELCGADYNAALIGEAQRLAAEDGLDCRFVVANAFRLDAPADVYLSTGVLHHFRGEESLRQIFAEHDQPTARGFIHFDFQPSMLAPLGAWMFHVIRMRMKVSIHDGVLSAVRAHSGELLLRAARAGAPGFQIGLYGCRLGPFSRPFHTVLGLRPALREAFVRELGGRRTRLEELR